jgi:hypothetical protein
MANQEQLEILRQGVEAWNEWRKEYPKVEAGLFEADLRGAKLQESHLAATWYAHDQRLPCSWLHAWCIQR